MNWEQWLKQNLHRILNEFGANNAKAAVTPVTPIATSLPAPTEHDEQVAVFAWANASLGHYPDLRWLFAVPNGSLRHPAVAARLKAEGVKAGVPDIFLPVPRAGYAGLWIELKRADRSNGTSDAQSAWIAALTAYGFDVAVCYGADDAIQVLEDYLNAS